MVHLIISLDISFSSYFLLLYKMANKLTPIVNDQNVKNVREQIALKKGHKPYLATSNHSEQVLTDYDTFPYPRWFRGEPESSRPVVAEREAGWRPRRDSCYKVLHPVNHGPRFYPNHCFQNACSTVVPCHQQSLKYSDRDTDNLNNLCTVQYR